jgi:hypothetical protein
LQSQSPAVGLEFIKYPPIVDCSTLQKAFGFSFRYTSRQAVEAYLKKTGAKDSSEAS